MKKSHIPNHKLTFEEKNSLYIFYPVLFVLSILFTALVTFLVVYFSFPTNTIISSLSGSFLLTFLMLPFSYLFVFRQLKNQNQALMQKDISFKSAAASFISSMSRLEQEKARSEAFLHSISDGVIATDKDGTITFINDTAQRLLGCDGKAVMGNNWSEALSQTFDEKGEPLKADLHPITLALVQGATTQANYHYLSKDTQKLPVSVSASPVKISNQVEGSIMVFKDITREKEIDKMKTEFISLASHQLRTPLSAVKWFSEMLLNGDAGKLTPQQKEFLDTIYASNERMIELVNALLNISRLESGKLVIEPKQTNLAELIEEIIKELEPKIKEKNLHVVISLHKDVPLAFIDPKLIRQVYQNLLTNAIKYTNSGGEVIVFLSKEVTNSKTQIVSQVTDNGLGIPQKDQKNIFERFFRAENVLKSQVEGTGLGLYLVKKIIETSGGTIRFESKEGVGTTFWFTLPIEE